MRQARALAGVLVLICLVFGGCSPTRRPINTRASMFHAVNQVHFVQKSLDDPEVVQELQNVSWRYRFFSLVLGGRSQTNVDFTTPWTSGEKKEDVKHITPFFCFEDSPMTNIMGVSGPGSAIDYSKTEFDSHFPNDLIVCMEVRDSGVHWMQPGDIDVGCLPRIVPPKDREANVLTISSDHPRGFLVGFQDGEVWRIAYGVPVDELRRFLSVSGAEEGDRNSTLKRWRVKE